MIPDIKESALNLFRVTVQNNPYLRKQSILPPQFTFLTHPASEMLYGGAASGGKSRALLMAALQFVMVPGYAACLVRRTFADLEQAGGLIGMSHDLLQGTEAKWNGQRYRWSFPSGAVLDFKYLDNENDKYTFQGGEYQYFGVDELTQFKESSYLYLFSRLRKRNEIMAPTRMRAATNPGGVGHTWVRKRFIDAKTRDPESMFIPAKVTDNTFVDQASYLKNLNKLQTVERAQLRDGNWDITASGNVFKSEWLRYYRKAGDCYLLGNRRFPVSDCTRFSSADIAGTEAQKSTDPDYTAVGIWDLTPEGDLILVHLWRDRMEIPDVEQRLLETTFDWNCEFAVIEKNGLGLPVVQNAKRRGVQVIPVVAKRDKYARAQSASIRMREGQLWFDEHAPYMDDLLTEMLPFPLDGAHDDQIDMISQASLRASRMIDPRKTGKQIAHETKLADTAAATESEEQEESRRRFVDEVMGDDRRIWHELA